MFLGLNTCKYTIIIYLLFKNKKYVSRTSLPVTANPPKAAEESGTALLSKSDSSKDSSSVASLPRSE